MHVHRLRGTHRAAPHRVAAHRSPARRRAARRRAAARLIAALLFTPPLVTTLPPSATSPLVTSLLVTSPPATSPLLSASRRRRRARSPAAQETSRGSISALLPCRCLARASSASHRGARAACARVCARVAPSRASRTVDTRACSMLSAFVAL